MVSAASLYKDNQMLAPMVRTGTLPMRRLCLDYGCDIVYSPEYMDRAVTKCTRHYNQNLKIAEYKDDNGKIMFSIDPETERDRLIFQIGTANKELAVDAAMKVIDDVAGIDLNCGCPKHFSVHNGSGSALLKDHDKLVGILSNLVENVTHGRHSRPVSCKIRITPATDEEPSDDYMERRFSDTVKLVRRLQDTGISALGIHARLPNERYESAAHQEIFRLIKEELDIPVIANGDIMNQLDIERVREQYQVDSVMMARAPQANPSVFMRSGDDGPLESAMTVARKYMLHSLQINNAYQNSKFVLSSIVKLKAKLAAEERAVPLAITQSKSMEALCGSLGMQEEYQLYSVKNQLKDDQANDHMFPYIPR